MEACLNPACGHHNTDTRGLLFDSALRLGGDPPSATEEERLDRLPVPGAHAVVDEDVEGGVGVGGDLQHPGDRQHRVLVAVARVHLRHEELHEPVMGKTTQKYQKQR